MGSGRRLSSALRYSIYIHQRCGRVVGRWLAALRLRFGDSGDAGWELAGAELGGRGHVGELLRMRSGTESEEEQQDLHTAFSSSSVSDLVLYCTEAL